MDELEKLIASLGELSPEQAAYAALARQLAATLMSDEVPGYGVSAVAREYRATLEALLDAPANGAGLSAEQLEELWT